MGKAAGVKSSGLNTENQFKYINLMNYVNRENVSNSYDNEDEDEDDDEDEDEDEEITGAGKYYYPKRFL